MYPTPSGIAYKWRGKGFGNNLILAHVVKILNDNEVPAALFNHRRIHGLLDVPIYDEKIHGHYMIDHGVTPNTTKVKNVDLPFVVQHLKRAEKWFGKRIYFDNRQHYYVPVKFQFMEQVPAVDVVICSASSDWGPYRDWPYFEELRFRFANEGITFKDLNQDKVYGVECLNYVQKCKLYLGLETGTSHYVSKFAAGKGLILQSGFSPYYVWGFAYDYDVMTAPVNCQFRPCFMDRERLHEGQNCPFDVGCMWDISCNSVFDEVVRRIGR